MCESGARSWWRHSSCPSSSCPHLASCSLCASPRIFLACLSVNCLFFSHVILLEASCVFLVQWHFGGAGEDFVRKVTSSVSNHGQVFRAVGEPLILPHCDMKSLRSAWQSLIRTSFIHATGWLKAESHLVHPTWQGLFGSCSRWLLLLCFFSLLYLERKCNVCISLPWRWIVLLNRGWWQSFLCLIRQLSIGLQLTPHDHSGICEMWTSATFTLWELEKLENECNSFPLIWDTTLGFLLCQWRETGVSGNNSRDPV